MEHVERILQLLLNYSKAICVATEYIYIYIYYAQIQKQKNGKKITNIIYSRRLRNNANRIIKRDEMLFLR